MKQIALILIASLALAGCNWNPFYHKEDWELTDNERYLQEKSAKPSAYRNRISSVYTDYNLVMPNGNRIRVCSAYSCTHKQVYRLSANTLRKAKSEFSSAWSASGERNGLEDALQYIETVMGPATGTSGDAQGGPWTGNGNSGQMDHQDEALNTTSILLVMMKYELIRYHDLLEPRYVGGTMYARLRDRSTGEIYGIDTGYRRSGGEVKIFNVRDGNP